MKLNRLNSAKMARWQLRGFLILWTVSAVNKNSYPLGFTDLDLGLTVFGKDSRGPNGIVYLSRRRGGNALQL